MPRRPRHDGPDTWHHVMNRGLGRRTILENDTDRRFFLALLGREVRAGRLEIHAFSLMLNHFHLLVRSVNGELSKAMARIQGRYARWFNRSRRRDGSLFKDRFLSRPIDSMRYRRRVVTYIHDNAVDAGIVANPGDYAWSSAVHFGKETRPRWLATDWIDEEIAARGGGTSSRKEALEQAFPSSIDEGFRQWVERQLSARLPEELEGITLKHAGSPKVVRWAIRKAKLADGTRPWKPVCPSKLADHEIRKAARKVGPLLGYFARKTKDAWCCLRAGLLRMLSGCTHREIGLRVGRHSSTISRDIRDHARLAAARPVYERLLAELAHAILAEAP